MATERAAVIDHRMTRTVLNGHGKPVVLTRENCTLDGWGWDHGIGWDDLDWSAAKFRGQSFLGIIGDFSDPHLRVPHKDGQTAHRVRGKRWKIKGLLP